MEASTPPARSPRKASQAAEAFKRAMSSAKQRGRQTKKVSSRLGHGPFRSASPRRLSEGNDDVGDAASHPSRKSKSSLQYRNPFRSPSPRRPIPGGSASGGPGGAPSQSDPDAGDGDGVPFPGGGDGPDDDPEGDPGTPSSVGDPDSDEEMPSAYGDHDGRVANAPTLPKPPQYRGRTMNERREFMRAYETYCFALSAFETEYNRPYVMPVKNCVEARTLRRICYYDLETTVELVTEEMLVNYFLEARVPEMEDYTALDKAMKSLKMDSSLPDAVSRVEKMIDDMEIILVKHNMDKVIRDKEPKKLVKYMTAALEPPGFRQAVEKKLSQEQFKSYRKDAVKFAKWVREMLKGYIVWETLIGTPSSSSSSKPPAKTPAPAAPGVSKGHPSGGGGGKKPPAKGKPTGDTAASGKPEDKKKRSFPCLKCDSTEHRVRQCPQVADEAEAVALIAAWREKRETKPTAVKKVNIVSEPVQVAQNEPWWLLADDDGCVGTEVGGVSLRAALLDSGADDSVASLGLIHELESAGVAYKVASAEGKLLPFGDTTIEVSRRILLPEIVLTTSAGPLRLRNFPAWVCDENTEISLDIGRPVMEKLGYSTDALLVRALQQKPVWDLASASEDACGTNDKADDSVGGAEDLKRDENETNFVRVHKLREFHRLEEPSMTEPDGKDFRSATPDLSSVATDVSTAVREAIQSAIRDARAQGLTESASKELERILYEYEDVFRLEFGADPAIKVPPLKVRLKPGAQPVKCKARRYPPLHREYLEKHIDQLVKAGLLYENHRSRWASPALVVPKKLDDLRMVVDTRRVNKCTEPIIWPMPNLDVEMSALEGSYVYFVLDWFRGYWQLLLHPDCREMFTIMTHKGLYTPTRVPMGATDSVAHCQGAVQLVFGDYLYHGVMCWLDDILGYDSSESGLLKLLERVLRRCAEYGLKLHPKKCSFFTRKVKWCGRMISGEGISHCPERISGLVDMPMPATAADLQQFLCAVNWMRTSIPDYAKRTKVLYELLDAAAKVAQTRKKKFLARIALESLGWKAEHEAAVHDVKQALLAMVPLSHPSPTAFVCLFTDASAEFWGAVVTQVPAEDAPLALGEQRHAPLAFLSGKFVGASCRWPTVEKEAYAIIESCKRLEYLLLRPGGFTIFTDHRNLLYIFNPEAYDGGIARYQADRLQRWLISLSLFPYTIEHVPGDLNVWGDLLSRWGASNVCVVRRVDMKVLSVAVERFVSPLQAAEFEWPSIDELRQVQRNCGFVHKSSSRLSEGRGSLDLVAELSKEVVADKAGRSEEAVVVDRAVRSEEAGQAESVVAENACDITWNSEKQLFCSLTGKLWVPPEATEFQTRLCVVAHAGLGGHRGARTTLQVLSEVFEWRNMATGVDSFVKNCLHCMRVGETMVPRPYGEAIHATKPNEVLHFDFLSMPESSTGLCYILVLKDDMSGFVELVPCPAASSKEVFHALTEWFARYGVAKHWVSDQGSHFKNTVIELLQKRLGAQHHFVVAYSPWANGTIEVVNRLVLRCLKALMSELRLAVPQWPEILPVVQMALNQSPADRLGGVAPVTAFTALPAQTPIGALIDEHTQSVETYEWVNEKQKTHIKEVATALEQMHKHVADASALRRAQARKRRAAQPGVVLTKFCVGDFVLFGQVLSRANKLAIHWKGPRRVVKTLNDYTFEVHSMVEPYDIQIVHASRMKLYAESGRELTEDLVEHIIHGEGGHLVESFLDCRMGRDSHEWEIRVKWFGLDALEASWEPARIMFEDQPRLVERFVNERPADDNASKMAVALGLRSKHPDKKAKKRKSRKGK